MLYEKKMLILSGSGKGVVLIEKSAHGTRFTLRTFDMPNRSVPLKAGIVTKTKVYVRDLPPRDNPAVTFTLELDSLTDLHFAVFDRELRLYGSTGKRLWEANLMDLLNRNDRRAPAHAETPALAPLPPIVEPPRVLPLPDGTGIPQSHLSVYGDDALADNDFYTSVDMSGRMPTVDGFLDTERVLDGLAPTVEPSPQITSHEQNTNDVGAEIASENDTSVAGFVEVQSSGDGAAQSENDALDDTTAASDEWLEALPDLDDAAFPDISDGKTDVAVDAPEQRTEFESTEDIDAQTEQADIDAIKSNIESDSAVDEFEPIVEVAADASTVQPWERTAQWIKKRGGRELVIKKARVKSIPTSEKLRHLRATEFFERARRDIDILFASARRDESLTGLIDDVEWVKVDVDGNAISVGRSGNAFLCYAVAGTYERTPPLGDEAQWLPVNRSIPTGKGYWVIFQNLSTGEIIK